MKTSTATSVLFQYPIQDAIQVVARLGFDGVDVWGGRPHVYRQDLNEEELVALRRSIEGRGLSVVSLMPAFYRYPHSLSNPNPRVREDSIDYMRQCIDNAVALGAGIVLVVPDHSLYGQKREESLARFIESVDIVSAYAEPYALKLGIEVLYYDETDFVNSADDALTIIEQVGRGNLGVVLDTGTLNLSKESPEEVLDKLGDLLLQVHVNDNVGVREQQNLIPGEGTFDFPSLIGVLKEHGYTGFLSAELTKGYADDPEPALRTTIERLRAWL
ncbi:MAG: TIM barrel protein [Chloroflexi bacterium]|nr:TIM barrel protein [Chloroflexota bacterium]